MNNFSKKSAENAILLEKPYLIETLLQDTYHTKLPRCVHCHDDRTEILFLQKGQGVHIIDGNTYYTQKDDIIIFDANILHEEFANPEIGLEILDCSVGGIQIKGLPPNTLLKKFFCPVIHANKYTAAIHKLLCIIHNDYQENHLFTKEIMCHLLSSLVLLVYQSAVKNNEIMTEKTFETGINIKNYIDKHYLEDINIPAIGKKMNLGESYISHAFKKSTGYSVMQYVIRRRIGEAQSWLLMSDLSVSDIAMKVGYNSVSNFQNAFRKIVGMSPQKYRVYWKLKKLDR